MISRLRAYALIIAAVWGLSAGPAYAQTTPTAPPKPPPEPIMRAVYAQDIPPDRRYVIRTEHPEFADESNSGAAGFNKIMRVFVKEQTDAFRADIADLPKDFEPEYTLKAQPIFPADGVISVRFHAFGVLGSGFDDLLHVTVDTARGRKLSFEDIFADQSWKPATAALCRKATAGRPAFADTCGDGDLFNIAGWWFEARRAVIALPMPGKERLEISAPYAVFGAALRPDAPVGLAR
jgi:hypothetical protein